jgi:HAE1 family hydrophobic/amphiphilic exporter-1
MNKLLKFISFKLLPYSFLFSIGVMAQQPTATPAQQPIAMPPISDQDLRDNPLLTSKPLPIPPAPDLTRVGVAGGEQSLSLKDAIRLALENNNDIEVSRDNVRLAEQALLSFEGVYDPLISFTPLYSNVRTPAANNNGDVGLTVPLRLTSLSFTPAVTKQYQTGGGQYQFFFNSQRDTSNTTFTRLSPFYTATLGVTFNQPLLRNRSIDQFRHDIRVQRKVLSQSDADFRLQVINVISQVQQAYWELVFARRDEQNQLENVNLAREQLRMIEEQVKVGTSSTLERAQALTQIATAETALLSATQFVTTTENALKQLLLRKKSASEWSNRLKPTDEPSLNTTPVNLTDALAEAYVNRPELSRLRVQQDINKIDMQFFKNQTLPRVDLQTTVSTFGLAGSLLPGVTSVPPANLIGGYQRALRNLGGFDTGTVSIGATIQFPLRNKTAKANLATTRIQSEQLVSTIQSQEQAIEVDVRNAVQAVETTRRQVITARSATKSAEIQLAGEMKRFQAGMSTTFLIFQFEDQLVNARTAQLRAEANYNQALANLQRATSTTLRANNVTVAAP